MPQKEYCTITQDLFKRSERIYGGSAYRLVVIEVIYKEMAQFIQEEFRAKKIYVFFLLNILPVTNKIICAFCFKDF